MINLDVELYNVLISQVLMFLLTNIMQILYGLTTKQLCIAYFLFLLDIATLRSLLTMANIVTTFYQLIKAV